MKFDLHVHTEKSIDSSLSADDLYAAAKRAGLDGVAVADHNVFLEYPVLDDLIIIPACEYSTDAGHLLAYFIKEPLEKALKADERGLYSWREVVDLTHELGGLVFMAHPFSPLMPRNIEVWRGVDGIEIFNSRVQNSRVKNANFCAQTACMLLGKPFSAGSDAHFAGEVGSAYWECDDFDLQGITREQALDIIKHRLAEGEGTVYGGTASRFYKVKSRYLIAVKNKSLRMFFSLAALFIYTLIVSVFGLKKHTPGYLKGWDNRINRT